MFWFFYSNTYGPIITYSRTSNNERNKERSFLSINERGNAFKCVRAHRLQNPKNIILGHLNVNSLRNKIIAVEEFIYCKVDNFFFWGEIGWNTSRLEMFLKHRKKHDGEGLCYANKYISCNMVSVEVLSSRLLWNNFDWIFHQNSKMALHWPLQITPSQFSWQIVTYLE